MARVHPLRASPSPTTTERDPVLAPDLLEAVRRRVVVLAWVVAVASLLMPMLGMLAWLDAGPEASVPLGLAGVRIVTTTIGVAIAVLSVILAGKAKTERRLEDVAIALTLTTAMLSGVTRHALVHDAGLGVGTGWSGISMLVVLLPVLVPLTPRRALLTGIAAMASEVASYSLGLVWVSANPNPAEYLLLFRGDAIAIGVAWVVARVVDDLRVKLYSARKLGSYELLSRLGQGGMGEVWRARHGLLARPAAIKLIKPDSLDRLGPNGRAVLVARFEREAQATALLESPHTIEVYDFGVAADGTLFYAMELLQGIDLHEFIIAYGRLPPARVAHLLLQACESLAEAHERGLIHRDIKPSNLFLCEYGGRVDFIKVLDFGLVKLVDDDDQAQLTGVGVTGTPAFLPPEQAIADRAIDARSDIYALGCVGYWLLTDHFVFEAKSAAEFIVQHVRERPIPPSKRVGVEIPEAFERLIMRALEKDPEDRPQTAREFADAIRATGLADGWTEADARAWWVERRPEAWTAARAG